MGIEDYKKSSNHVASNEQLVLRVYEKAITVMWTAREKMLEEDGSGFLTDLHLARQLFTELVSCLSDEEGPEMTAQLRQLYIFVLRELSASGFERSVERLENAIAVAEQLYEGFFGAFSPKEEEL
jgi:flagellar biosynthetic protein FliS